LLPSYDAGYDDCIAHLDAAGNNHCCTHHDAAGHHDCSAHLDCTADHNSGCLNFTAGMMAPPKKNR